MTPTSRPGESTRAASDRYAKSRFGSPISASRPNGSLKRPASIESALLTRALRYASFQADFSLKSCTASKSCDSSRQTSNDNRLNMVPSTPSRRSCQVSALSSRVAGGAIGRASVSIRALKSSLTPGSGFQDGCFGGLAESPPLSVSVFFAFDLSFFSDLSFLAFDLSVEPGCADSAVDWPAAAAEGSAVCVCG